MDISPWVVNQLSPAALVTLQTTAGVAIDLTGATSIALVFVNIQTGVVTPGVNTPMVVGAATNGQISYQWAAADVAVEGEYAIRAIITYPSGPKYSDRIPFSVRAP